MGAALVCDLSIFNAISLSLSYKEFVGRLEQTKLLTEKRPKWHKKGSVLPMIASECPGWVCYAEKRVGDLAAPNMSATKSAQQLFGSLAKLHLSRQNHPHDKIKVVTVMPCYDKKLEAVRPDFKIVESAVVTKEVDTVLATHELLDLFKLKQINFNEIKPFIGEP